jgi:Cu-Zn family superoxide dismutase
LYDDVLTLDGTNSIIGRTVVLHAKEDDKGLNPDPGSKTTGNAGARIACGVVGYDVPPS